MSGAGESPTASPARQADSRGALEAKYQRLLDAYSRQKSKLALLTKACKQSQARAEELAERAVARERYQRDQLTRIDTLEFHNKRLTKRLDAVCIVIRL